MNLAIVYAQMPLINAHADVSNGERGLDFGLSLHLHPFFVYVSSKALTSLHICADSPDPSLLEMR